MNYLNESFDKKYNVDCLLTVVDDVIMKMKDKQDWGYSLPYYLSGIYGVHPSYILTFMERKTLNSSDIRNLIGMISDEKKAEFDLEYANGLYNSYNNRYMNDSENKKRLIRDIGKRPVLLIGPGKTLKTYKHLIMDYIDNELPYVVSINGQYSIKPDAVFFSNKKRYGDTKSVMGECRLLATSNITSNDKNCIVFDYGTYLARENGVSDNALLMFLNILREIGVENVSLAGFDGYIMERNFYKGTLELLLNKEYIDRLNKDIIANLNGIRRDMRITSLTPSIYFRKEAE